MKALLALCVLAASSVLALGGVSGVQTGGVRATSSSAGPRMNEVLLQDGVCRKAKQSKLLTLDLDVLSTSVMRHVSAGPQTRFLRLVNSQWKSVSMKQAIPLLKRSKLDIRAQQKGKLLIATEIRIKG